ncbi:MAG: hypothetical protein AB4426_12135 [Xenococcaceae cyanobacterium]
MHILTKEEFIQKVEPMLRRVFVGNDMTKPFLQNVEERIVLYFPIGGDLERSIYWERQLAEALSQATKSISEPGCYLVSVWEGDIVTYGGPQKNRYAYISQSELVDALAAPPGSSKRVWTRLNISHLDFCLCSVNGDWGLLTTVDDHGFLGGNSEFMQVVRQVYPEIETQVLEWLHDLRLEQMSGEGINVKWIKEMLSHVYGANNAEQMIVNSGLTSKKTET